MALAGKRCDFFFSSRRRHTRSLCDWSSDVCSSDLDVGALAQEGEDAAEIWGEPVRGIDEAETRALGQRRQLGETGFDQGGPRAAGAKIGRASCRERV